MSTMIHYTEATAVSVGLYIGYILACPDIENEDLSPSVREYNVRNCGFVKSALYVLEIDDKSSFSMSGHVARPLGSFS